MIEKKQCNQQSSVAYKSCIDSYYRSKDRNDIYEYWLYLQEAKRFCEAAGVLKALELIEIMKEINGKT
tara:strand:+ start:343 stop:546 length:204 start_codon:yes stop_codon:yes gene_type:complete